MRKKLLALLMCATMVLGSSAVAFASPSTSDKTKAKEVFTKNGAKITSEYTTNSSSSYTTITATGTVNKVEGTYAFVASDDSAVKVNSKNKALAYIGTDVTNLNTKEGKTVTDATTNPSAYLEAAVKEVADANGCIENGAQVAQVVKTKAFDSDVYTLVVTTFTTDDGSASSTSYTSKTKSYSTASDISVDSNDVLTEDVDYMTADGYSYDVADVQPTFRQADKRAASGSDANGEYWYALGTINPSDTQVYSVAMAIQDELLTTSAAAVKINVYRTYTGKSGVPAIQDVTNSAYDVTVTLDCDLLSNTSLKKTATSLYTISGTKAYDGKTEYNKVVALPGNANVDFSAAYGTFDISLNSLLDTDGGAVLIFEQGENEAFNDGVSDTDTTTASSTAATSPKTGDIAPIAALAVVMMGACGAMVVASKKRA
jgi:hypothetical protein